MSYVIDRLPELQHQLRLLSLQDEIWQSRRQDWHYRRAREIDEPEILLMRLEPLTKSDRSTKSRMDPVDKPFVCVSDKQTSAVAVVPHGLACHQRNTALAVNDAGEISEVRY